MTPVRRPFVARFRESRCWHLVKSKSVVTGVAGSVTPVAVLSSTPPLAVFLTRRSGRQ